MTHITGGRLTLEEVLEEVAEIFLYGDTYTGLHNTPGHRGDTGPDT